MNQNKKFIIAITGILFSILIVIMMFASFYIGRIWITKESKALIVGYNNLLTLGNISEFENIDLSNFTVVYDSTLTADDLKTFAYDIPKVPTPFVGTAPKPGKFENAHISNQQFRYDREIKINKPEDVYRIFFTGGSVAFGSGAPDNKTTISAYLENLLNDSIGAVTGKKYEVINAACPAWATTQERIWIENYLSGFNPDMIISFSGNNDAHWSMQGANSLFFRSYWDHFFNKLVQNSYSSTGFGNYPEILEVKDTFVNPVMVSERLSKNLKLIISGSEIDKYKYVFVLQPNLLTTKKQLSPNEQKWLNIKWNKEKIGYFNNCYNEFKSTLPNLNNANFTYVDLSGVFDSTSSSTPVFFDAYHFGDRGNKIVANSIYKEIKSILVQ